MTTKYVGAGAALGTKAPQASPTFTGLLTTTGDALFKSGRPWADIRAFGAIGDGADHPLSEIYNTLAAAQAVFSFVTALTQTQDYAAIQAAIFSLTPLAGGSNSMGGDAYIPEVPYPYIVGTTIILTFGVNLRGASRTTTFIKLQNGANTPIVVPGGTFSVGNRIEHITFDGNKANNTTAARTSGANSTTASNNIVTSTSLAFVSGDVGRVIRGGSIPAGTYITIINSGTSVTISQNAGSTASGLVLTIGGNDGLYLDNQRYLVEDVTVQNCKRDGIRMAGYLSVLNKLHLLTNDGYGLNGQGWMDSQVENVWCSGNVLGPVYLYSSAQIKMHHMQLEGGTGVTGPGLGMDWSQAIWLTDSNIVACVGGVHLGNFNTGVFIKGNLLVANNAGGADGTGSNIDIAGGGQQNIVIEGNVLEGQVATRMLNQILVADPGSGNTLDRVVIEGNTMRYHSGAGVGLPTAPAGTLTNLSIRGNPGYALGSDLAEQLTSVATAGTSQTLDVSTTNVYDITLSAASCAITFIGATASKTCILTLVVRQGATGGRLLTWPATTQWAHGIAPALMTTANAVDVITLLTNDGGTTWLGLYAGPDMRTIAPFFPGLQFLYLSDSLALPDSTAIASWPDSSGVTGPLIAAGTARPTAKTGILNGLPSVRFDGAANGMQTAGNLTLNDFHVFIVANVTSMGMLYEHSASANVNPGSYLFSSSNNSAINRSGSLVGKNDLAGTWANGLHLLEHTYAGAGPAHDLWKDGVKQGATVTGPAAGAAAVDLLNVGARNAASLFTAADVFVAGGVNRVLTAAERATLVTWINNRYATAFA